MNRYAGIFVLWVDGVEGAALAVDTDEIQFWADSIAEAGFAGVPLEVKHIRDLYDGPSRPERLAQGDKWRDAVIAHLKGQVKEEAEK